MDFLHYSQYELYEMVGDFFESAAPPRDIHVYYWLAGPRFGFARNYFKFVLIGACVHALIRIVTTRNNNYFTFIILPIWHFSGGLRGHLRSKT